MSVDIELVAGGSSKTLLFEFIQVLAFELFGVVVFDCFVLFVFVATETNFFVQEFVKVCCGEGLHVVNRC